MCANVPQGSLGDIHKPQAAHFCFGIEPRNFAGCLNAISQIQRKPELNVLHLSKRSKRCEAQSRLGNIQYLTALIPGDLDEPELGDSFSYVRTAFLKHR